MAHVSLVEEEESAGQKPEGVLRQTNSSPNADSAARHDDGLELQHATPKLQPLQSCLVSSNPAMATPASEYKDRQFLAVIGDEVFARSTFVSGSSG